MITKENFLSFLISIEPEFQSKYESYLAESYMDPTVYGNSIAFLRFVQARLKESTYDNAAKVFDGIELLLTGDNSDDDVKNAICTGFLEGLQSGIQRNDYPAERVFPFLGVESISYCKEWDDFNFCRTPGLWAEVGFLVTNKNILRCLAMIDSGFLRHPTFNLLNKTPNLSAHDALMAFLVFVQAEFKDGNFVNASRILYKIEFLLTGNTSDEEVKAAVCNGFLKGLQEGVARGEYPGEILDRFLGPLSKEYWKSSGAL